MAHEVFCSLWLGSRGRVGFEKESNDRQIQSGCGLTGFRERFWTMTTTRNEKPLQFAETPFCFTFTSRASQASCTASLQASKRCRHVEVPCGLGSRGSEAVSPSSISDLVCWKAWLLIGKGVAWPHSLNSLLSLFSPDAGIRYPCSPLAAHWQPAGPGQSDWTEMMPHHVAPTDVSDAHQGCQSRITRGAADHRGPERRS